VHENESRPLPCPFRSKNSEEAALASYGVIENAVRSR
jgi:hypothetical protein